MLTPAQQSLINEELSRARQSRLNGSEGQARVCARRAAGIAIGAFIHQHHLGFDGSSAYDRLAFIQTIPSLPEQVYQSAGKLLMRVDEAFNLPADIDLIEEAQHLIDALDQLPPDPII